MTTKNKKIRQWEYAVFIIPEGSYLKRLEELGHQGWELVNEEHKSVSLFSPGQLFQDIENTYEYKCTFKRKLLTKVIPQ